MNTRLPDLKTLYAAFCILASLIIAFTSGCDGSDSKDSPHIGPAGSLDTSFDPGDGPDDFVSDIAVQEDGMIVISGAFKTYSGSGSQYLARIDGRGALDESYMIEYGFDHWVPGITIDRYGKIIATGYFKSYEGVKANHLARINADGTLDETFDSGSGAGSFSIGTATILNSGKILVGGRFSTYNGTPRNHIARIYSNGQLDTSFVPDAGINNDVKDIIFDASDIYERVLIGGEFSRKIARLNDDGSLDSSFDPGTGAGESVETIALQSDGKILIGGAFTTYNGTSANRIARINIDGSLDSSFIIGTGFNGLVNSIIVQTDGKILVAGGFTDYNGAVCNKIARLNDDGSIDTSFDPGAGTDGTINIIVLCGNGRALIGGNFTSYNHTQRNRVARIFY